MIAGKAVAAPSLQHHGDAATSVSCHLKLAVERIGCPYRHSVDVDEGVSFRVQKQEEPLLILWDLNRGLEPVVGPRLTIGEGKRDTCILAFVHPFSLHLHTLCIAEGEVCHLFIGVLFKHRQILVYPFFHLSLQHGFRPPLCRELG
ncbi:hypothetical protein SDC9_155041 [bioreactor metagenome]|uniref:Uncharacterized protein n=1 Tax=bioreactor metagenome TaxID=1076179 RepID=A0A645F2X9_9ZZZZ